ncbi:MAG TPA: CcmD family protein [Polyangiaceae bacterium]|jgi:hypothetical protein
MNQPQPSATPNITSFEAQAGAPIPEQHSGVKLLVTAYIAFWLIAMTFVLVTWLRQRGLANKVDELERALDRAESKSQANDDRLAETIVKDRPKSAQD